MVARGGIWPGPSPRRAQPLGPVLQQLEHRLAHRGVHQLDVRPDEVVQEQVAL